MGLGVSSYHLFGPREMQNYFSCLEKYESAFREILVDLMEHGSERPKGYYFAGLNQYIPDAQIIRKAPLEDIVRALSSPSEGRLQILDFYESDIDFDSGDVALNIAFQDVAPLSGGGAELVYRYNSETNELSYLGCPVQWDR